MSRRPGAQLVSRLALALAILLVFAVTDPRYASAGNAFAMLEGFTNIGLAALAVAITIIAGEFDLSIGSMVAFAGLVFAALLVVWQAPVSLAILLTFAFAVSLGEFGATSFLVRPERPTLPVVIYELISRPGADNFGMALAASVVLGLLTVTVMGLVERLRVGSMGAF